MALKEVETDDGAREFVNEEDDRNKLGGTRKSAKNRARGDQLKEKRENRAAGRKRSHGNWERDENETMMQAAERMGLSLGGIRQSPRNATMGALGNETMADRERARQQNLSEYAKLRPEFMGIQGSSEPVSSVRHSPEEAAGFISADRDRYKQNQFNELADSTPSPAEQVFREPVMTGTPLRPETQKALGVRGSETLEDKQAQNRSKLHDLATLGIPRKAEELNKGISQAYGVDPVKSFIENIYNPVEGLRQKYVQGVQDVAKAPINLAKTLFSPPVKDDVQLPQMPPATSDTMQREIDNSYHSILISQGVDPESIAAMKAAGYPMEEIAKRLTN